MFVAIGLFLLSPVTLFAWAAGQALLRVTGLRWWKLALASLATIAAVIAVEGGPGPALAQHFSGYVGWLRQTGTPVVHLPMPGAFLWPQLPLAVPVGLLAAALNLAGRRQAIDPAEVAVDLDAEGDGAEVVVAHGGGPADGRLHPAGGVALLTLDLGRIDGLAATGQIQRGGQQADGDCEGELGPQERPGGRVVELGGADLAQPAHIPGEVLG